MDPLKIEKGIPIPQRGLKAEGLTQKLMEMEIGDSIKLDTAVMASNAQTRGPRLGLRFTYRKVDGGWRVWLVEKIPKNNRPS